MELLIERMVLLHPIENGKASPKSLLLSISLGDMQVNIAHFHFVFVFCYCNDLHCCLISI